MPPISHTTRQAMAWLALGTLAACGGQSSPAPAPAPAPAAAPTTTLSLSVSQLALAVSGQARALTVTNMGVHPALSLTPSATGLPAGTTITTTTCGATLAAGASCTLTFTPGATPTALPGNANPPSALIEVTGSNTNTLTAALQVITYGSLYQGGYVFDIDDSTSVTGSIGGKVAAPTDSTPIPFSIFPWSLSLTDIPASQSLVDGAGNTTAIVADQGAGSYAAQVCAQETMSGQNDWYLPALCELGYAAGAGVCGTQAAPVSPGNLQRLLGIPLLTTSLSNDWYWSSTQGSAMPTASAHVHLFDPTVPLQGATSKSGVYRVRCARALTP